MRRWKIIEACVKIGKRPQKAYSGQVMFRISRKVHRRAALAAAIDGKSLNQWAEEVLGRATSDSCAVLSATSP